MMKCAVRQAAAAITFAADEPIPSKGVVRIKVKTASLNPRRGMPWRGCRGGVEPLASCLLPLASCLLPLLTRSNSGSPPTFLLLLSALYFCPAFLTLARHIRSFGTLWSMEGCFHFWREEGLLTAPMSMRTSSAKEHPLSSSLA